MERRLLGISDGAGSAVGRHPRGAARDVEAELRWTGYVEMEPMASPYVRIFEGRREPAIRSLDRAECDPQGIEVGCRWFDLQVDIFGENGRATQHGRLSADQQVGNATPFKASEKAFDHEWPPGPATGRACAASAAIVRRGKAAAMRLP